MFWVNRAIFREIQSQKGSKIYININTKCCQIYITSKYRILQPDARIFTEHKILNKLSK